MRTESSTSQSLRPSLAEAINPPVGFSYVEDSIARCWYLAESNIGFLKSSNCGAIVNVTGQHLCTAVLRHARGTGIDIHDLFSSGSSPLTGNVPCCCDFMKKCLELVLKLSRQSPVVFIVGSELLLDCVVVACLRRLQEWSYVSILSEFRMNAGCRNIDMEQFIEFFDPDIISLSESIPEFLQIHMRLKNEEGKLFNHLHEQLGERFNTIITAADTNTSKTTDVVVTEAGAVAANIGDAVGVDIGGETPHTVQGASSCRNQTGSISGSGNEGNVQDSTDSSVILLGKLLFSSKIVALTAGNNYDPTVSLINDKDDDD